MSKRNSPAARRLSVAALILTGLFLASSAMAQTMLDLDHVSICGSDLDALRQSFANVGLASDLGGPHGNGVTQMALVGFDDQSYIELIAPVKAGVTEGSDWAKLISDNAGTCAWAVGTNVLLQEVDRLKKAGVSVTDPKRGNRKRADGMNIEWMTAQVGPGTPGSLMPFVIEDETPRAWRVQTSEGMKGSPIGGLDLVVVGVNNLDSAVAMYRKAYGWSEPLTESQKDFGKLAYFPGQPVILAAGGGWVSDRVSRFGEGPVAFLLSTKDFGAATKKYKLSGNKTWFAQKVAWFDASKIKDVRLGVIGQ